jgi:hypothetical protein
VPEAKRTDLMTAFEAHEKANPIAVIRTLEGRPLTDAKGKALPDAPTVAQLSGAGDADFDESANGEVETANESQD